MSDGTEIVMNGADDLPLMSLRVLRLRLARCESESFEQQFDLIKEIVGLGNAAVPLMPLLMEKYRANRLLLPVSTCIELYRKTRFIPLLDSLQERGALAECSVWDKCWLLENGLPGLEPEILDYLWKLKAAGRMSLGPGSMEAVKSLGNAGGSSALEMLEVIRNMLLSELPEKKAKWMLCRSAEEAFDHNIDFLECGAHEELLEAVRTAIGLIKARMEPSDRRDKESGEVASTIESNGDGVYAAHATEPAAIDDPSPVPEFIEAFHAYDLIRSIPGGGMAAAFLARNRQTGQPVFVKRVRNGSADKNALDREVRNYQKLMQLRMPDLLEVLDFVRDDEYTALVMEFADGGDLEIYVPRSDASGGGGLPAEEAKGIAVDMAQALKGLHTNDFVHRDLKPKNVLRAGGRWKLADFGISKNLTQILTQKTFQQCGTLGYAAPEQFDGTEARPSADIYSLGKLIVFLLTGQTDVDLVRSTPWRELLRRMVQIDPKRRPTIEQVADELQAMPA